MIGCAASLSCGPEGAIRYLDPVTIAPSRWSAVENSTLRGPAFDRLKSAIERFGGNVQPIKVRSTDGPLLPFTTGCEPDLERFEVVFGYSRLLACLELGLPVYALVECLSDHQLAQQFVSEFSSHPSWRPWRLSLFVKRTIDGGLFPSLRRMADALAMDNSEAGLLYELASLPEVVRRAFANINFTPTHARKLILAFQRDPDSITRNAAMAGPAKRGTASSVLAGLSRSRA